MEGDDTVLTLALQGIYDSTNSFASWFMPIHHNDCLNCWNIRLSSEWPWCTYCNTFFHSFKVITNLSPLNRTLFWKVPNSPKYFQYDGSSNLMTPCNLPVLTYTAAWWPDLFQSNIQVTFMCRHPVFLNTCELLFFYPNCYCKLLYLLSL